MFCDTKKCSCDTKKEKGKMENQEKAQKSDNENQQKEENPNQNQSQNNEQKSFLGAASFTKEGAVGSNPTPRTKGI
jgi:hypothetical protein